MWRCENILLNIQESQCDRFRWFSSSRKMVALYSQRIAFCSLSCLIWHVVNVFRIYAKMETFCCKVCKSLMFVSVWKLTKRGFMYRSIRSDVFGKYLFGKFPILSLKIKDEGAYFSESCRLKTCNFLKNTLLRPWFYDNYLNLAWTDIFRTRFSEQIIYRTHLTGCFRLHNEKQTHPSNAYGKLSVFLKF